MVQWVPKGSKLKHIDLDLEPGKRRVITLFQDESSFYVNEFKKSTWYAPLVTLTLMEHDHHGCGQDEARTAKVDKEGAGSNHTHFKFC
jgi:hypothetical protein